MGGGILSKTIVFIHLLQKHFYIVEDFEGLLFKFCTNNERIVVQ